MRVELNDQGSDMYGEDGPEPGARGEVYWVDIGPDGDVLAAVKFDNFDQGIYYVRLDWIVWPNTESSETYFSTIHLTPVLPDE